MYGLSIYGWEKIADEVLIPVEDKLKMKLAGTCCLSLLYLTSCVGGGIVVGKKEEKAAFAINETRSKPMRRVMPPEGKNPSQNEIRSSWGEPSRKKQKDGEEVWVYHSGLSIRGAVPMLGIGIPLIVPVGKNGYDFHFSQGKDRAEKLVVRENNFKGGYFGVSSFSESKGIGFHKLGE